MENREEIKQAIESGNNVYWENLTYQVIIQNNELFISSGDHMMYLEDSAINDCFIKN